MKKSLFISSTDWNSNACLNWGHDPMSLYIEGYKSAAETLATKVVENSSDQDTLVYPIVFLYRQYIELTLKRIIESSRYALQDGNGFPEHHKIKALWDTVNALMKKLSKEFDPKIDNYITKDDVEIINSILSEFVEVDPESFAFRYPHDKKGKRNLNGIKHINIKRFSEQMTTLSELLGKYKNVSGFFEDYILNSR